jgi:hypothetical protein
LKREPKFILANNGVSKLLWYLNNPLLGKISTMSSIRTTEWSPVCPHHRSFVGSIFPEPCPVYKWSCCVSMFITNQH